MDIDTVRYTLSGMTSEAVVTFSLAEGAVADYWGNHGVAYSGSFMLDIG